MFFKWFDFKNFGFEIVIVRVLIGVVIIMDKIVIVRIVNFRGFNVLFLFFIVWFNVNLFIVVCGYKNMNVSF